MKLKRFTIALLSFILLCCMDAVSVSASYDCEYLGDLPETELGVDVDAVKDEMYENALCLELNRQYPGEEADPNGTHGKAWLVYYNDNLYAYVEIYDSDIVTPDVATQVSAPWETDSVEIFLNAKNSDDENDTIQYRIDVTGCPSIYSKIGIKDYGPVAVGDRFEYAQRRIDGGYALEFGFMTDSRTFGIQMQINDKTSDGKLYHVMSQSEFDSKSWSANLYPWTSVNGEEKQTEETKANASETEETKANASETEAAGEEESVGMPTWAIILIVSVVVVAVAGGVLVAVRKKKNS